MSSAQNSDILLNFVYNLKNVENSRGGVLLLQLQALTAKKFFVRFRLVLSSVALVKKTRRFFKISNIKPYAKTYVFTSSC